MDNLDIKQEYYFTINFKAFGLILIFGTLMSLAIGGAMVIKLILLAVFTLLTFIMFTTRYGLLIDVENSSYMKYTWFLGQKKGQPVQMNKIEKIYINEVLVSKTVYRYSSGIGKKFQDRIYKAFMKLDDGTKVHLDTDHSEEVLADRVNEYALALNRLIKK
ncbi:MAG: hypothetical protein RIC03_00160 [Cyclobacteriaceae bacterium]